MIQRAKHALMTFLTCGCSRRIIIAMKVVLALVIAALSAIELVLLAWLVILLFVAPGGSAEFKGVHQFAYERLAEMYLPIPAFVVFCRRVGMLHAGKPQSFDKLCLRVDCGPGNSFSCPDND